ncbi:MAG: cytochrome P450 [Gemmobacter sp.]
MAVAQDLAPKPAHVPADLVVDFCRFTAPELKRAPHRRIAALYAGLPPVFWTPRNGGHWIAARSSVAMQMLKRYDLFSSDPRHCPAMVRSPRTNPNQYDPPEHTAMRAVVGDRFDLAAIPALEDGIRARARALIDAAVPRGGAEFLAEIAQRFPVEIFLDMAGAPLGDRDRLLRMVERFTREPAVEDRLRALRDLADFLQHYLDERAACPGTDLLSAVAHGRAGGRPLTADERQGMAALLFLGGLDTVAAMLSFIMAHLALHQDDYRRLVADPDRLPRAVHELIRYFGVASMERAATGDFAFEGVAFRAGDRIVFTTQTYGLDNPRMDDPLRVDLDRRMAPHAVFGAGAHRCLGAHLAQAEIRIFLEEWIRRFAGFALAGGEEPETVSGIVWSPVAVPLIWSPSDLRG